MNRITIHLRENKTFNKKFKNIATYHTTEHSYDQILASYLTSLGYFPINLNELNKSAPYLLPNSFRPLVFNIRNDFNVFGHFFLWTGYLVMADIIMTITFLGYWFLVVQPHQMVPSLDKLVDKMVSENILIFANTDQASQLFLAFPRQTSELTLFRCSRCSRSNSNSDGSVISLSLLLLFSTFQAL